MIVHHNKPLHFKTFKIRLTYRLTCVGEHEFYTGTIRYLISENEQYSGIFCYFVLNSFILFSVILKKDISLSFFITFLDSSISNLSSEIYFTEQYSGIFCYFVSGGLEHYYYLEVNDDLEIQELWNNDFTGISKSPFHVAVPLFYYSILFLYHVA